MRKSESAEHRQYGHREKLTFGTESIPLPTLQKMPALLTNDLPLVPMQLPSSLRVCDFTHNVYLVRNIPQHAQDPPIALYEMIRLVLNAVLCSPVLHKFSRFPQVVSRYTGK